MNLKKYNQKLKEDEVYNLESERLELKANQEMIAYQNDKPFIDSACEAISNIKRYVINSNKDLAKGDGLNAVQSLEKILTDRFGVRFIVGNNDIHNAFCYTNCSKAVYSTKDGDFLNFDKMIKASEDMEKKRPDTYSDMTTKKVDIEPNNSGSSLRELPEDAMYTGKTPYDDLANVSYFNFLDKVRNNGFKMDLKNAKIINANKNQFVYINFDFNYLLLELNEEMTTKEFLSIMLHEIGHAWTELERTYMVFKDVFLLNDILIEEYGKKEKSPADAIRIFYTKSGIKEPKKLGNNYTDVSIAAYSDIIRGVNEELLTNHSKTNHEQLADEFAGRFGLSSELTSGLFKMGVNNNTDERQLMVLPLVVLLSVYTTQTLLLVGVLAGGIMFMFGLFGILIATMFEASSHYTRGTSYDTLVRRLKRLRNTSIRRLNVIDDKIVKESILKDLDEIDKNIKAHSSVLNIGSFRKLSESLAKHLDSKGYQEMRLNELIEDLSANEINVAKAEWNKLKG